ncbi:tail fiber protein [Vibrio phage vB_VhaS_MAG7]|nr:tail fiber protein [Vibrio phage vB_VhaS_MAG7]
MSLSPNEKYPGATAADPNYKDSKFKDNNPSTTNNGSPLKALDRNEQLALQEAMMNAAGFDYNGVVDTPQNSQMFAAYKAALSNGANLLSNHNFIIASPDDSQPAPSATPTSYPPGYEIFSGVFANETTGITNLTYSNGLVSFTAGDFYIPVANAGGVDRLTEFVASVADFDGKPRQLDPSSWSLVGGEYRVTVGVSDLAGGPLGSVKFEQGSVATGHEVGDFISEIGAGDLSNNGYSVLPQRINGHNLILQWGRHPASGESGVVSLPITYPNAHLSAVGTPTNSTSVVEMLTITNLTISGISFATYGATTGSTTIVTEAHPFNWFSIGY